MLTKYHWPGNIRDLENAMKSAIITAADNVIKMEGLPLRLHGYAEINVSEIKDNSLEEQVKRVSMKIEKELIVKALEKSNGNRTSAAGFLKISRKTLFNKIKLYNISDVL